MGRPARGKTYNIRNLCRQRHWSGRSSGPSEDAPYLKWPWSIAPVYIYLGLNSLIKIPIDITTPGPGRHLGRWMNKTRSRPLFKSANIHCLMRYTLLDTPLTITSTSSKNRWSPSVNSSVERFCSRKTLQYQLTLNCPIPTIRGCDEAI